MIVEYTIENIKDYYLNNDVLNDINIIENVILNKDSSKFNKDTVYVCFNYV